MEILRYEAEMFGELAGACSGALRPYVEEGIAYRQIR